MKNKSRSRSRSRSRSSRSSSAGSYLATKRRKYKNVRYRRNPRSRAVSGMETGQHNDLSVVSCGEVVVGSRAVNKAALGTVQYRVVSPWLMSCDQGRQCVDYAEIIFNRNHFTDNTSDARLDRNRIPDNLFALSTAGVPLDNAIYQNIAGDEPLARYTYIRSCKSVMEVVNLVSVACEVKVYYVTPVFDTSISPIDAWVGLLESKRNFQVGQGRATTVASASVNAGFPWFDTLGENPFTHSEFRKQWKCLKKHSFTLQPGAQHSFSMNLVYNKAIARATIERMRTDYFLAGITVYPLFIVRSGLLGVTDNTATAATDVSYGAVKLGVVHNFAYELGMLSNSSISANRVHFGAVQNIGNDAKMKMIDDTDEVDQPHYA